MFSSISVNLRYWIYIDQALFWTFFKVNLLILKVVLLFIFFRCSGIFAQFLIVLWYQTAML